MHRDVRPHAFAGSRRKWVFRLATAPAGPGHCVAEFRLFHTSRFAPRIRAVAGRRDSLTTTVLVPPATSTTEIHGVQLVRLSLVALRLSAAATSATSAYAGSTFSAIATASSNVIRCPLRRAVSR
jgi:hypothetical protein